MDAMSARYGVAAASQSIVVPWREHGALSGRRPVGKTFLSEGHPCERIRPDAEKLLLDEKNCGLGIVQDVAQFARREPDIQRQQNGSRFQNAVIRPSKSGGNWR